MNYQLITHLPYRILKARGTGLKKTPYDKRDFKTGIFGWFDYKPKHQRHILKTLSVRDQGGMNTCAWNATTVQKETDEGCRLSVRSLVIMGKILGYISQNGFSNLRDNQKVLQKWGILKEGIIPEDIGNEWNKYSDPNVIRGLDAEAAKHKIKSYWNVESRNDVLKLLDDGRKIVTGMKWYTAFNMSNGFKMPWLIYKAIGWFIGGHAILIKGYDLNYEGREVYHCQNSFGKNWGLAGDFYVDIAYLDKDNYGYFTNLDEIDNELGKFIMEYDGRNVKGKGDSAIFHIQAGKKKPYTSWLSFLSWEGMERGFIEVDKNILDRVETGDIMDFKKSKYYKFLKDVEESNQMDKLLEILLNKEKTL